MGTILVTFGGLGFVAGPALGRVLYEVIMGTRGRPSLRRGSIRGKNGNTRQVQP